jgi:hypothetical protein
MIEMYHVEDINDDIMLRQETEKCWQLSATLTSLRKVAIMKLLCWKR